MAELGYDRNFIVPNSDYPNLTAFNQFAGIGTAGEPNYERRSYDNPPFMWPSKQYMNIAGDKATIQRGYMRSLITDPQVSRSSATKNRRLFFQFNPQVLVRSVQQSVGAMNPLLQDPAQLVQPIPGTSSFGFELFFNREKEVFTGNNSGFDMSLPDGTRALVSQIGVLADIMVLDTITGQGLSQDLIDYVTKYTKGQYDNTNRTIKATRESLKKAGATEADIATLSEYEKPTDKVISDIFNANIGNSAFLNPLPFRVMFSSLFMVEGLATSIDVQFQKFSRTMVPTQCKVTINMYALYIGFAKKKTFLYDNLTNSSSTQVSTANGDDVVYNHLKYGIKKVTASSLRRDGYGIALTTNFDRTDDFKNSLKNNFVKDVKVRMFIHAVKHPTQSYKPTFTAFEAEANKYPLAKRIGSGTGGTGEYQTEIGIDSASQTTKWYSPEFEAALSNGDQYFSFMLSFQLVGVGSSGNVVEGPEWRFSPVYGIDKTNIDVTNIPSWTGTPQKVRTNYGGAQ